MKKRINDKTFSEFVADSSAEHYYNGLWMVYCDGKNKTGSLFPCYGNSEFEAKESAWEYLQNLFNEPKNTF